MKKLNKKGFTIVELVIVIAVIAILAAVLIPTFATVIKKANINAALQGGRNAYTAIMAETEAKFATVATVDGTTHEVKDAATTPNVIIDLDDYIKDIKTASFSASTITVETNSGATVTIAATGVTAAETPST